MNRALLVALVALPASIALGQAAEDNNAWKGRLYCLAAWAKGANPEAPKSIQEAFLDGPVLLPRKIPGVGRLEFPMDTASDEARRWFGQGLACLHLLWNEEAERAFRSVVASDPECAMGYWGLAMVNVDRPGRASYFARMAVGKLRPATSREVRGWVEVLGRFHEDPSGDLEPRFLRLASDFEDLAIAAPQNTEAKALYLRQLVLNAWRGGIELRSPWAVDRIAVEIAAAAPSHPASQQRLFLWMGRKPDFLVQQGLLDPKRLPPDPLVPQLRFFGEAQLAAGQWVAGAESLTRAVGAGVRQRTAWFERPITVPGFDENVEVLGETLSRIGRVEDALALARSMMMQPLPARVASINGGDQFTESSYARGLRLYAQTCIEHGLHERLEGYADDLPLHPSPFATEVALRGEITALADGGEPGEVAWLSPEARLAALVTAGRTGPAAEILESLPESRHRAFLPRALEILHRLQAGQTKEAMLAFDNAFRSAAGASDSPLCGAQGFLDLARLRRITGAWKLAASPAASRLRSDLPGVQASYQAGFPPAPGFTLPDGAGSTVRLADYRGKPVLVIFFLGAGCLQCVEQLHAFLPLGPEFEEAGIPILTVSSDPVEVLKFTIREEKRGQRPIPFKIVSDVDLEAFRKYFVYNEFEKRPVHGTFLIDADGKVRWWTTDNQPFMNPKWLLAESRRILSLE